MIGALRVRVALAALLCAGSALAAPVRFFQLQSAESFARGTLEGVRLDPLGALELAPAAVKLAAFEEPYVLAVERAADGWVVGTGSSGKVLFVNERGEVRTLFATEEPEVFAVAVAADGTVYAASSPNGKVYRFRGGKAEVFFSPGEEYVWDLALDSRGGLLVATGTAGKLFRVAEGGRSELLLDASDTHLRSLLPRSDGSLLIGTASPGRLLERGAEGKLRTLLDPPQSEIAAVVEGAGGGWYAAAVSSEASWTEPGARPTPPPAAAAESAEPQPVVTVTEGTPGDEKPAERAAPAGRGPRSELFRGRGAGVVESVASFDAETVFALAFRDGRLWIATGVEGGLYSLEGDKAVLERDFGERQVVGLAAGPSAGSLVVATTNAGALYRLGPGRETRATYTSAALDAGQRSRFGAVRWEGSAAGASQVRLSFRSGSTPEPDATWSDWSAPAEGREISAAELPAAQYAQLRLELAGDGKGGPRVAALELAYRQENLAPKIQRFSVLDPGMVLIPLGFNPADQLFEPAHPTRGGVFTTLAPTPSRDEGGRLKQVWKKGYRTLRWKVEDPNGDPLEFDLAFRAEASADWLAIAAELDADYFAFDEQALPDGVYRFRLRASDRRGNPGAEGLAAERVTEPIVVDQTPPRLLSARKSGGRVEVEVEDARSPLRLAEWSSDGGEWQPAAPVDGLLDGRRERLLLEPPAGARYLLLRLIDSSLNVVSLDCSEALR